MSHAPWSFRSTTSHIPLQLSMRFLQTLTATVFLALARFSNGAETNLLSNGTFEDWSGGVPISWATNAAENIFQATGLGSGSSPVVQNNSDLRQATPSSPESFTLSFTFAVNQSPAVRAFSQSLIFSMYQTTPLGDSANAWISVRLQTNNASNQPFSLSVLNGDSWESLTEAVFVPSVLNDDNKSYASVSQYQMSLTFNDTDNTYSISYGPVGGKTTTLKPLAYFRNPTEHSGLKGLQFYSNDNGFALANVQVSAAP